MMELAFFGTPDLPTAFVVIFGVFGPDGSWNPAFNVQAGLLVLLVGAHLWRGLRMADRAGISMPAPVRAAFWVAMVLAITYGTPEVASPFIYFRF